MKHFAKTLKALFAAVLCVGMVFGSVSPAVADVPTPYFSYIDSVFGDAYIDGDEIHVSGSITSQSLQTLKIVVTINEVGRGQVYKRTFSKTNAAAFGCDATYKYTEGKDYIVYFSFYSGSESTSGSVIVNA